MIQTVLPLLDAIARTPLLLVACDYDGTLSDIVPDPASATPRLEVLRAFRQLGNLHWTRTAIVSGRSLSELRLFVGEGSELQIGSHGAEWCRNGVALEDVQRARLNALETEIRFIVGDHPGTRCEVKPAGVALHYRTADRSTAHAAADAAMHRCAVLPGVHVRRGSEVVEFMVVAANKGEAMKRARRATGATAVVFIGDDETDEDVFLSLMDDDVSIKVGEGGTRARCRVQDVSEVGMVLRHLLAIRGAWIGRPDFRDSAVDDRGASGGASSSLAADGGPQGTNRP